MVTVMGINMELIESLAKKLSHKRYEHTLAVTQLSCQLAEHYGIDHDAAWMAAMLHDITKEQDLPEQLQILKQSDIIIDSDFEHCKCLYHSTTAYLIARGEVGITDVDVLNAIRYHTSGRTGMSMLEKIVYVADACSYDRQYEDADRIRKLSFEDIDEAMIEIIEFTINECVKRRKYLATLTVACYNEIVTRKEKYKG